MTRNQWLEKVIEDSKIELCDRNVTHLGVKVHGLKLKHTYVSEKIHGKLQSIFYGITNEL